MEYYPESDLVMADKKIPDEVEVVNEEPLIVEIADKNGKHAPQAVPKAGGLTMPPTTTEQEDLVTAGQRHINLIWENTQSRIALMVVIAGILVNSLLVIVVVIFNKEVSVTQLSLVSICLQFINLTVGIIIGFYFSRTNHSATGGTGARPAIPPYTGR